MAYDRPKKRVEIKEFGGLFTQADPFDITPNGALVMQDCHGQIPGQLTPRKGHAAVTFANAISPTTAEVMACYYYPSPLGDYVIYTLNDGVIKAGRAPS